MKRIVMFTIALITLMFVLLGIPAGVMYEALKQGFNGGRDWFKKFSNKIRQKGVNAAAKAEAEPVK